MFLNMGIADDLRKGARGFGSGMRGWGGMLGAGGANMRGPRQVYGNMSKRGKGLLIGGSVVGISSGGAAWYNRHRAQRMQNANQDYGY